MSDHGSPAAGPHVLVIDDEPSIREVVAMTLELFGWTVSCAEDGAEGLRMARAIRPDVVLLDVMMPEMDGFTVMRELHAGADGGFGAPVILLTAKVSVDGDPRKLASLGAAGLIRKPFDPLLLVEEIERIMRSWHRHRRQESGRQEARRQLRGAWLRHRDQIVPQVDVLESAAGSLLAGRLPAMMRERARAIAGEMADACAMFGHAEAARLAAEIDQRLADDRTPALAQGRQVEYLVASLRVELGRTDAPAVEGEGDAAGDSELPTYTPVSRRGRTWDAVERSHDPPIDDARPDQATAGMPTPPAPVAPHPESPPAPEPSPVALDPSPTPAPEPSPVALDPSPTPAPEPPAVTLDPSPTPAPEPPGVTVSFRAAAPSGADGGSSPPRWKLATGASSSSSNDVGLATRTTSP